MLKPNSYVAIGFGTKGTDLSRLPGINNKDSWGYHGDDGHIYPSQRKSANIAETFSENDVVGCCIDAVEGTAFFTKNGKRQGTCLHRTESLDMRASNSPFVPRQASPRYKGDTIPNSLHCEYGRGTGLFCEAFSVQHRHQRRINPRNARSGIGRGSASGTQGEPMVGKGGEWPSPHCSGTEKTTLGR